MLRFARPLALVAALVCWSAATVQAASDFIVLQSTTSTENSGLFDAILPAFTAQSGITVRVVAVGTGQAIRNARNGDGDVLLVHSRADEEAFVASGFGVARFDVMYNDFVLVGPADDPARLRQSDDAAAAMAAIFQSEATFVSRGDDSGTHKAEMRLWRAVDLAPEDASGTWYREVGAGMGATLNAAVAMGAYTLTDRATWLAFRNKQSHRIVLQGDAALFNQYGVIRVNEARHPHVKAKAAQQFVDWLISQDGQAAIAAFRIDAEQVFFPNAR